jgi:hypothetical protein
MLAYVSKAAPDQIIQSHLGALIDGATEFNESRLAELSARELVNCLAMYADAWENLPEMLRDYGHRARIEIPDEGPPPNLKEFNQGFWDEVSFSERGLVPFDQTFSEKTGTSLVALVAANLRKVRSHALWGFKDRQDGDAFQGFCCYWRMANPADFPNAVAARDCFRDFRALLAVWAGRPVNPKFYFTYDQTLWQACQQFNGRWNAQAGRRQA